MLFLLRLVAVDFYEGCLLSKPGKQAARRRMGKYATFALCAWLLSVSCPGWVKPLQSRLAPGPGNISITPYLRNTAQFGPFAPGTLDHPLFHSSYTGEPGRVVAHTKYGDISAQDFYLWLIMREGPHRAYLLEAYDKSRTPADRESLANAIRVEIDEYVFTNYIVPEIMGNAPCDGVAAVKEQIYLLPAYQLAYIKSLLEPTLCVLPADRVKYLQEHKTEILRPETFRTRYIFKASGEADPLDDQDATEQEMNEIREEIVTGKISFSEAARSHSEAPSAERGGEIPAFKTGELFFFYEEAAAGLQPGEVSHVFRGPRGYYMVQLLEAQPADEPNLADPVQAQKVEEALTRQILREAYDWDLRSLLQLNRRPKYHNQLWDLLEDCDPVAQLCDFEITKQQLRDAFPEIEGDDLRLRKGLVETWLKTIVERSAMALEVKDHGKESDPWLQRGRWMAANLVRRDGYVDKLRCSLEINEPAVRRFWAEHPRLFTPLAVKRLIRVTMAPLNTAPLPSQTRDELHRILVQAGGGAPTVAVVREKLQPEEISAGHVVRESFRQTEKLFQALEEDAPSTTEPQAEILPEIEPAEKPVNAGVMIPGLKALPSPGQVTSGTLAELRGGGTSEPPQGGGCVPLSSGVAPPPVEKVLSPGTLVHEDTAEMVPPRAVTRPSGSYDKVYAAPSSAEEVELIHGNWRAASIQAPPGPDCKPLPASSVAPAVAPGLQLQRAPNENKQLVPPETSNYPFNPDWFFARIDPTNLRAVVKSYISSDFVLKYDDLGYVYTEDVAAVPPGIEAVPVGAFSNPYIVNNQAVSYYVEDARTVEKPPFEKIKTHAYSTYEQVQTDKELQRSFKDRVSGAGISYTFEQHSASTAQK
ncbi:MAG: peptidylprolyl isomerase [Candidatus Sumerlaeaceae bacterium]